MQERQPAVYIMTNKYNGTLYVGVTSNLAKRVYEHKHAVVESFTKRYGCKRLVYYECYEEMIVAIMREKQIKGGSRKHKRVLIEKLNPYWLDLYETIL